jgi:alpha-galactosidase
VQHGVLYRPATEGRHTTAVHYASADGDEHVVIAWRPQTEFGLPRPLVRLTALEADAVYVDVDRDVRISGAAARTGLPVDVPGGDYASALIHLRRVG